MNTPESWILGALYPQVPMSSELYDQFSGSITTRGSNPNHVFMGPLTVEFLIITLPAPTPRVLYGIDQKQTKVGNWCMTAWIYSKFEDGRRGTHGSTYLGFTSKWSCFAHFLGTQGVDDGALANIGIAYEADANLLLVLMQLKHKYHFVRQLTKKHQGPLFSTSIPKSQRH